MAKKHTPAWQLRGMAGPPPVDAAGYHSYGVVWRPEMGSPSWWENFRTDFRWAMWSYRKFSGQAYRATVKDVRETVTRWREKRSRG